MIRPATSFDIPRALAIYHSARQFMRRSGNTVQWVNGYPSEALLRSDVAAGRLEIGVTLLPAPEEVCQWFSFVKDKLELVLHPSHRLAGKGAVALAELAAEEFILFQEDFLLHDRIINDCVSVGFQPKIAFKSTQWDFISEMVAANLGVALLPGTICRQLDKERVCLAPLVQPEILWHLAVIWRKDRYLSFAAREWLNFTRQRLQEAGAGRP